MSKSPRLDTCQERPFGSTPNSGRRVLSANRTLDSTGADLVGARDDLLTHAPRSRNSTTATLGGTREKSGAVLLTFLKEQMA
jgi:hypothetical protein